MKTGGRRLQHVSPYSTGGETSSRNMVTLCEPCNQSFGDELSPELYHLAGLHYGYEPSLVKLPPDRKAALHRAGYLSHNLMHTRCDLW
ncbi:HNH endonuclease [Quatrionicoccus australiensis]|uniref:HNH endonuclease n=1 Tax=Quatrionicoccus australiensis TaxID=138118 RepID=UPI001CFA1FFA